MQFSIALEFCFIFAVTFFSRDSCRALIFFQILTVVGVVGDKVSRAARSVVMGVSTVVGVCGSVCVVVGGLSVISDKPDDSSSVVVVVVDVLVVVVVLGVVDVVGKIEFSIL